MGHREARGLLAALGLRDGQAHAGRRPPAAALLLLKPSFGVCSFASVPEPASRWRCSAVPWLPPGAGHEFHAVDAVTVVTDQVDLLVALALLLAGEAFSRKRCTVCHSSSSAGTVACSLLRKSLQAHGASGVRASLPPQTASRAHCHA